MPRYIFIFHDNVRFTITNKQMKKFISNCGYYVVCKKEFDFTFIDQVYDIDNSIINFVKFMITYPNNKAFNFINPSYEISHTYFYLAVHFDMRELIDYLIDSLKFIFDTHHKKLYWLLYFTISCEQKYLYGIISLMANCMVDMNFMIEEVKSPSMIQLYSSIQNRQIRELISGNKMKLKKNNVSLSLYHKKKVVYMLLLDYRTKYNQHIVIVNSTENIKDDVTRFKYYYTCKVKVTSIKETNNFDTFFHCIDTNYPELIYYIFEGSSFPKVAYILSDIVVNKFNAL